MSESVPFLFLFISLSKDKNFLMDFNVDIPPYITRISSGLEDRTRKHQTRYPSEDIPTHITLISIGLEDNNKQQARYPSEDIPPYITRMSIGLENNNETADTVSL